jgi:hypothetical protein
MFIIKQEERVQSWGECLVALPDEGHPPSEFMKDDNDYELFSYPVRILSEGQVHFISTEWTLKIHTPPWDEKSHTPAWD